MSVIRSEMADLEYSGISRIAVGALDDPEVIPLWFGESDIVTPEFIRDAAKQALDAGKTFYSYARGHLPLREALVAYHKQHYKIDLHPDRVTVPGSTMLSVAIACQCMLSRDDEIILVGPYWPNIRIAARVAGARGVDVRLREGPEQWHLDLSDVAAARTAKTKAIYINSPSNPTGWIMSGEEQQQLLQFCRNHNLGIIADEVYHRNVYDSRDPAPSFLEIADENEPVFVLNGFSKAWAMTGWRLGWMVAPRNLVEPMAVLAECNNTSATAFVQYGGIAALEQGEGFVAEFRRRLETNRDLVMEIIGGHPRVTLLKPEGAFYAFPKIDGVDDSLQFARKVLAEAKVGIAPGYTFGIHNSGHVRLCFAIASERLEVALRRLRGVIDRA